MATEASDQMYNVLLEERVAVAATRTQVFQNAPKGTKFVKWTCQSGATIVVCMDGTQRGGSAGSYPASTTDGHPYQAGDWYLCDGDAKKVYALDLAGGTSYIFVTYLGGRITTEI